MSLVGRLLLYKRRCVLSSRDFQRDTDNYIIIVQIGILLVEWVRDRAGRSTYQPVKSIVNRKIKSHGAMEDLRK